MVIVWVLFLRITDDTAVEYLLCNLCAKVKNRSIQ